MISVTMTPEQYSAKKAALQAQHQIALQGDQGTVADGGYTIEYRYDGTALQVTALSTPRFIPKSLAEGEIKKWIES